MFTSYLLGAVLRGLPPIMNTNQRVELEPGQILRGEILKAFPNQMVQVQIGGAVIHAQLNAPLEVGQQAWLQVLPQSNPITLKVIDRPSGQNYNEQAKHERQSVEQLLRAVGIKADRTNVQNLNRLLENKIVLKSSDLSPMLELMRQYPATERIIQLFQLAQQRSIPITKENILSLESAIFGQSLEHIVEQLTQVKNSNPKVSQLVQQLNRSWDQVKVTMSSLVNDEVRTIEVGTQPKEPAVGMGTKVTDREVDQEKVADQGKIVQGRSVQNEELPKQQNQTVSLDSKNIPQSAQTKEVSQKENALLHFLKLIGLDYESEQLKNFSNARNTLSSTSSSDTLRQIKGILLELNQMDSLPAQVKESVEQGIRSITGQQLLLLQDHQSPWQSSILQIAFPNILKENEPSYVHVEGRKSREGIDVENCRLFFHLQLDALDTTMIDIHITSRRMNIVLYNDHDWVKTMIEESKEEWKRALEPLAYQIANIKVLPTNQFSSPKSSNPSYSMPSTYQGVDIRI